MQHIPPAVSALDTDLREIFGVRLESVVMYGRAADGAPVTTMAVVSSLSPDDLQRCAQKAAAWHEAGLATPLVLGSHEFERSLDVFPFEFGAIVADHAVVSGRNPFEGVTVDPEDLRRACEVQARSHLLHLREGYIETRGRSDRVAELVTRSAAPFAALLANIERVVGGTRPAIPAEIAQLATNRHVGSSDAVRLFPEYLSTVETLVRVIDEWGGSR